MHGAAFGTGLSQQEYEKTTSNHPIIHCNANLDLQSDPQNRSLRQYPLRLWTAQSLSHLNRSLEIRTLFPRQHFMQFWIV